MSLVTIMFVIIMIIIILYQCFTWKFTFWKSRKVIGPKPLPFFGNYLQLALDKEYSGTIHANIYRQYAAEKIVGIYRFMTPVLLVRDLDVIKHILIKDFHFFQHRGVQFSKGGLGGNLFHSDGDTWNSLRKKLSPLFSSGKIKTMYNSVSDRAEAFVNYVDTLVDGNSELEINKLTEKYTADIIGTCAYGIDIDAFNDNFNKYIYIGRKQFTPTWRMILDMLAPGILITLNIDLMVPEVVDHYENILQAILKQRNGKISKQNDFMDSLIDLKERGELKGTKVRSDSEICLEITDSLLAAQAFIFFGAGFETSSTVITMALYELSLNQEIQEKVVKEIAQVLEKHNGKCSYEAIREMIYLDRVMLETLRKYPVVDQVREAVEEYKIPGTDVTIPRGTHVVIPQLGINYDPKYYPDPERFDPARFSRESQDSKHICASMPFGAGPRECIASRFASMEVKTCLVHVIRRYQVTPPLTPQHARLAYVPLSFTLSVAGGVRLCLARR